MPTARNLTESSPKPLPVSRKALATPVAADGLQSRVRCDVDFDRPGRQAAYLRAPQSRNTSGWGVVEIPLYVFNNGKGPTLLLTGGVHGDEYEGQIAISRLAQTPDVQLIGERGVRNMLRHLGMTAGKPDTAQRDGAAGTPHMMVRDATCYSFAPAGGIFEPRHVAGETVQAGQTAGFVHFIEDIDHAPTEVCYGVGGVLWMASGPGRVQRGDCVAVVMKDYAEPGA